MRKWVRIIFILLGLLIVAITGFVLWGNTPLPAMPAAMASLTSDAQLTVEINKWIIFQPVQVQPETGFIFYPGGRVDAQAYAPAARAIAQQGYLVVIVRMPLNLAVFAPSAAVDVITAYPAILHWVVGGHSLGGAMAANFAKSHPGMVAGLALWAAYPASSDDLSASGLRVVSIYGSRDGLATGAKIDASRSILPADTTWITIQGGNHAQFGWYGDQPGDNPATISRQDQQDQIVHATLTLLESLKK
jgi:predicted esterase